MSSFEQSDGRQDSGAVTTAIAGPPSCWTDAFFFWLVRGVRLMPLPPRPSPLPGTTATATATAVVTASSSSRCISGHDSRPRHPCRRGCGCPDTPLPVRPLGRLDEAMWAGGGASPRSPSMVGRRRYCSSAAAAATRDRRHRRLQHPHGPCCHREPPSPPLPMSSVVAAGRCRCFVVAAFGRGSVGRGCCGGHCVGPGLGGGWSGDMPPPLSPTAAAAGGIRGRSKRLLVA